MNVLKNLDDLACLVKTQRMQAGAHGRKMSALTLAELAGVSRDTIHRVERGEDVSFETAMRILRVFKLGLNAQELVWPTFENANTYYQLHDVD